MEQVQKDEKHPYNGLKIRYAAVALFGPSSLKKERNSKNAADKRIYLQNYATEGRA